MECIDIYGDADDFTEDVPSEIQELEEAVPDVQELLEPDVAPASDSKSLVLQANTQSLPAKPPGAPMTNTSYSAHVAKQFSAYQQTPSQERQQRMDGGAISLNPHINATRNLLGDSSSSLKGAVLTPGDTVFGKKPSEMHDTG